MKRIALAALCLVLVGCIGGEFTTWIDGGAPPAAARQLDAGGVALDALDAAAPPELADGAASAAEAAPPRDALSSPGEEDGAGHQVDAAGARLDSAVASCDLTACAPAACVTYFAVTCCAPDGGCGCRTNFATGPCQ